jgi:hypothetical protein
MVLLAMLGRESIHAIPQIARLDHYFAPGRPGQWLDMFNLEQGLNPC